MNPEFISSQTELVGGYIVPMDAMADYGDFSDFDGLSCTSCQ